MILSPDYYLTDRETGEYIWTPQRAKRAWKIATSKLRKVVRDPRVVKVVLMVGIPASGKSTWLRSNREPGAVYFDATFTTSMARRPIIEIARHAGKQVEAVVMVTPIRVCLDRNSCRTSDREIPHEVVSRMAKQLANDPPTRAEGFDKIRAVKTV